MWALSPDWQQRLRRWRELCVRLVTDDRKARGIKLLREWLSPSQLAQFVSTIDELSALTVLGLRRAVKTLRIGQRPRANPSGRLTGRESKYHIMDMRSGDEARGFGGRQGGQCGIAYSGV